MVHLRLYHDHGDDGGRGGDCGILRLRITSLYGEISSSEKEENIARWVFWTGDWDMEIGMTAT